MSPWILVLALLVALVILACSHAIQRRRSLSRRAVSQHECYCCLNQLGFRSLVERLVARCTSLSFQPAARARDVCGTTQPPSIHNPSITLKLNTCLGKQSWWLGRRQRLARAGFRSNS